MERRKATFNGNRNGIRNGSRGNFGKRTFGPTDAYELPSAASTLEEKVIVAALKRCGGDGVPSRSLQREAGIHDKDAFYDALHSLKDKGEITVDKDHWVKLVPRGGDIEAQIVSLSERFGFARPKLGGEDIFVPGSALKGAFVGDQVILTDLQKRDKGPSGRVKRIVARSEAPMTGTVHVDETGARVTPDGSLRYDLRVAGSLNGAKDMDKVLIAPKQDSRGDWTQAEIQSVFGTGERARVCADAIIVRCGIPTEFPPEVLAEAEEISKMTVTPEDIAQRVEYEPIFTIDSADAKDLDDAICVHKTENGYKLGVHIADVSHYVKAKSAIDNEAYRRGTSVYFADRVIPMLPEALSNGVCSLNAGTEKLTFSALMEFDTQGNMTHYEFRKAVINSKVRGVYSEVNEILAGTASQQLLDKYTELNPNVHFETTPSGWDGYFEKLATDTATGGMADIVQMDYMYISTYAKNGSLADLSEYASNGTLDISNVDDALMDAGAAPNPDEYEQIATLGNDASPVITNDAAFHQSWNNFGTIGANAGNDTLELLVPPVKKAGEKALWYKPGMFFSVSATSKVQAAAAAFISWFLNSDEANDIMLGERGTPSASTARDHLTSSGALSEKQVEMFDFVSDAADYCGC